METHAVFKNNKRSEKHYQPTYFVRVYKYYIGHKAKKDLGNVADFRILLMLNVTKIPLRDYIC